jgi:hypothetical protein
MENRTPFDLNAAIQQWRENLAQSPAFRSENLYELETHLCDSIARLQSSGLSAEEAFLVATKRIGNAGALESEYTKFNGSTVWLDRALWMLFGIQFWSVVSGVVFPIARGSVAFSLINYDFITRGRAIPALLFIFANLVGFAASIAFCWWVIYRRGSRLIALARRLLPRYHSAHLAMLAVILLSGLSIVASVADVGMLHLRLRTMNNQSEILRSQTFFWVSGYFVKTITLVLLTLFFARKRLRLNTG